ncbi:hypothetical protein FM103_07475 [Corynebacterium xerosis]|nr:hypothetical protein FM103_07475 [Corynebacterium xerosis]
MCSVRDVFVVCSLQSRRAVRRPVPPVRPVTRATRSGATYVDHRTVTRRSVCMD